MKLVITILVLLVSLPLWANRKGIGLSLGNPTGLNGKYWLDNNAAVDGGVAWSMGKHSNFSLHSDYLLHKEAILFFNEVYPLDLHYGVGGRMEMADDIEVGIRIPIGLSHTVENGNADVFTEAAPIFDFISKTGVELHILLGGRYYF